MPHALRIDSEEAHLVDITTPAGHERFFELAGDPTDVFAVSSQCAPPDFERMASAAAQTGLELLGPPPFAD